MIIVVPPTRYATEEMEKPSGYILPTCEWLHGETLGPPVDIQDNH